MIVNGTFDHLIICTMNQMVNICFRHYLKTFKASAEATFVNVFIYNIPVLVCFRSPKRMLLNVQA